MVNFSLDSNFFIFFSFWKKMSFKNYKTCQFFHEKHTNFSSLIGALLNYQILSLFYFVTFLFKKNFPLFFSAFLKQKLFISIPQLRIKNFTKSRQFQSISFSLLKIFSNFRRKAKKCQNHKK
jgi:hypothetical protein